MSYETAMVGETRVLWLVVVRGKVPTSGKRDL